MMARRAMCVWLAWLCGMVTTSAHATAADAVCSESSYRALSVEAGATRTFADQVDLDILPVPWFGSQARDLIACGREFASRNLLYRFLRLEKGVPVYAAGVPYEGPGPRGGEMRRVGPGVFDLYFLRSRKEANGQRVDFIERYAGVRGAPQPVFRTEPERVEEAGTGREFHPRCGDISLVDVDGDGVEDLLMSFRYLYDANRQFPWAKTGPWGEQTSPYAGYGRGYDIFGRWLGAEAVAQLKWSKGVVSSTGALRFSEPRPVLMETPDFPDLKKPLTWKQTFVLIGMNVLEARSGRYLVLVADIDRLAALKFRVDRHGDVRCEAPRPLLAEGYRMPHSYNIRHLRRVDLEDDGQSEFLLDGNPGTVAVLRGTEPGTFRSERALIEGGDLCGETLVCADRYDWDGDGRGDIILSDATGWLTFWGGTKDSFVYRSPKPFTCENRPIHLEVGPTGSIQGYGEYRWAYASVRAGTWGGARGLMTVDAAGRLLWHEQAHRQCARALKPFRAFVHPDGRPYHVAWRSRIDFAPSGFDGLPHGGLVIQDLAGDLALAVPDAPGSLTISETRKLLDERGEPMHYCRENGHWGRGMVTLTDWDGDGRHDLLFSTIADNVRIVNPGAKLCTAPYFLRNVGCESAPRFAKPVPLRLKADGKRLNFGWHVSPCSVTDLDGDGGKDLIVGAENGKVYGFRREELTW